MRLGWTAMFALLGAGAPLALGQELSIWRVTNPADTAAVGPVEPGALDATTGPSSCYAALKTAAGMLEAGVYLEPNAQVSITSAAGGMRVEVTGGTAMIHYTSTGQARTPLVAVARGGWVRLQPDALLRIEVSADDARFLLGRGRADRFAGAVPADNPAEAQGGEPLIADPAVNQRARSMIAAMHASSSRGRAIDWIGRAEGGDLAPTERFSRPSTDTYVIRTTGVVTPRAASVTTPPQLSAAPALSGGFSQAQALLASQNPASVVVGARLERTRIVGNPGAAAGGGIQFNTQARPPLQLGTPLR